MEEVIQSAPLLFLILLSNMGVVADDLPDKIEADVVVPQTRWRMNLATTRQKPQMCMVVMYLSEIIKFWFLYINVGYRLKLFCVVNLA